MIDAAILQAFAGGNVPATIDDAINPRANMPLNADVK
jgi:hypothetical protein